MRAKVDFGYLWWRYRIWGYIGERFSIYLSKIPFVWIGRSKCDKTILLSFLWLRIIYIPLSVYEEEVSND